MNEHDLRPSPRRTSSIKNEPKTAIKQIPTWTEDIDSRQATKRDLVDIARALRLQVSDSWTVGALRKVIRGSLEAIER